jgi:heme exporter protein D
MNFGPHVGFIVSAYGAAIVIVAALISWVMIDRRRLRREIAKLEAQGITRRSDRTRGDTP